MSRTTWFEHARERFERPGEYPLIDDAEIIPGEALYRFWPWLDSPDSAEELREQALRVIHSDLPIRFVYLNLFYRLAHYPAEQLAVVVEDQDNASKYREQFLKDLGCLVRLVDISDCREPRQVRWEIVNACAVRDWGLARQLYERMEGMAEKHVLAQVLAQRGQQEFLSVFADRWDLAEPWCWAPLPDKRYRSVLAEILLFRCTEDSSSASFSDDELERLRDAAHHLERAIRAKQDLSPVIRFLLLRCNLVLGRFQEAAMACEELLAARGTVAKLILAGDESSLVSALYSRLVEAHRLASQFEQAISANEQWIKEFPNQAGTFERLSRLYAEQGKIKEAYEYLRKEVDRNEARGEDPGISMALAFGEVYRDPAERAADFEKRTDPEKLRSVGLVVRVLWPEVEKLDAANVEDWVRGCACLLWRELDDAGLPIYYFGKLVESELRMRLFDRFRESLSQDQMQSLCTGDDRDPLTNCLRQQTRPALGEMLQEFVHWNDSPRSRAAKLFREWLRVQNPPLPLWRQARDLRRMCDLYNSAKHRGETLLSWNDAEDMARLSRMLLSGVIRAFQA